MTRSKGVSARIATYLAKHPGEVVTVRDISNELGLKASQVVQTMWNLRARRPEFGSLETLVAGKEWRYNPNGVSPEERRPGPRAESSATSGPVLTMLLRHKNQAVSIEEIAKETGLEHDQIRRALSNLRTKGDPALKTIVTGHVWRYVPADAVSEPEPEPESKPATQGLFEQVGQVEDTIIVRGEDESLYALRPLKLDI